MRERHAVRRVCWLLYTDANTRFNLLADECNHLQETIYSLVPRTSPDTFDIPKGPVSLDTHPRPLVPGRGKIRDTQYNRATPQERALRNLWVAVGALATGLAANQAEFRKSYRQLARESDETKTDSLYWFISNRAHFLDTVFPEYLQHIQHAHQKMVQLIENMPLSLPGPILLRRWSSGGYGELLSQYSRHVHWRTQDLFWDCCVQNSKVPRDIDDAAFEDWRGEQYLVHTWSHVHTSRMSTRRLRGDAPADQIRLNVTSIWSSYFYLEQPVLFPLLYHECAHQYLDRGVFQPTTATTVNPDLVGTKLWFGRAEETGELLRRIALFPTDEAGAWQRVVGEIWVDAVAIALAGEGYVFALALQLIGFDGDLKAYSDYDTSNDVRCPLEDTGTWQRRIYQVHYADSRTSSLWESRILLAIRLFQYIHCGDKEELLGQRMTDIRALVIAWQQSGSHAMAPERTSRNHSDHWHYRAKINDWVYGVVWSQIQDFATHLQLLLKTRRDDTQYLLDMHVAGAINKGVAGYGQRIFDSAVNVEPFPDTETRLTLDEICLRIRGSLAQQIINIADSQHSDSWFEQWAVQYADYMRNDGSAAFRLGVEYIGIMCDIVRTASWILSHRKSFENTEYSTNFCTQLPKHEAAFFRDLLAAMQADWKSISPDDDEKWISRLNKVQTLRRKSDAKVWSNLNDFIEAYRKTAIDQLTVRANGQALDVGTFTLGVLRPAYIGRPTNVPAEKPYATAFTNLREHYEQIAQRREIHIKQFSARSAKELEFYPLFGEYNFAVYEGDFTPVEKDIIPPNLLPCITKSRAVIRVCRQSPECSSRAFEFLRVAQIGFKYRWQWVELAKVLPPTMDMYISSAWEDVLLISRHDNFVEYRRESENLGVTLRPWLDIHSSLGLPTFEPSAMTEVTQTPSGPSPLQGRFEEEMQQLISKAAEGSVVRERTGRYDVDIRWAAQNPQALWITLNKLPSSFWRSITSITTSFTRTIPSNDADIYNIDSQIMKRHDI